MLREDRRGGVFSNRVVMREVIKSMSRKLASAGAPYDTYTLLRGEEAKNYFLKMKN